MSLTVEFAIVVCGLLLALIAPRSLEQTRAAVGRWFRAIGRSEFASLLICFIAPLIVLPSLTLRAGIPHPFIHDEFVYLFMGETFSRGELTNPTPEHAEHFRSPHLILEPTFQGKYPVGQGVVLAVGKLATGYPITGVWLSFACAAAAICWMLRAWLPGRWAVFGALLFSIHPMIPLAWGETYWGGAVAAFGGALLYGSVFRLSRQPSIRLGVILGFALVLLANTRPYEGLIVSIPAGFWTAAICSGWIRKRNWAAVATVCIPAFVVLSTGAIMLGVYNHAVTGSAFKLPYQVWAEQSLTGYDVENLLFDNKASRATPLARSQQGSEESVVSLARWQFKFLRHHFFFLRVALVLPLMALPWLIRKKKLVFVFASYSLVYLCVLANLQSGWSHYYAPATPLLFLLLTYGLRQMSAAGYRPRCLATVAAVAAIISGTMSLWEWSGTPYEPQKRWVYARAQIERFLESESTPQIVVVRYPKGHDPGDEWVWNTGRPEAQHLIWAHSLGASADGELVASFPYRTPWLLDVGRTGCRLRPYRAEDEEDESVNDVFFAFRKDAPGRQRQMDSKSVVWSKGER
ncbi:MAG: hypothetical protein ACYTGL_10200 [Planctomycetota bacterium]|jgi:hypothetical protein